MDAQSSGRCHQALWLAGVGPVLCGTPGFEESLPELVSERLYTVLRHFGASEGLLRVIQGLIQLTQYRCRAGKILSEPFTMQRGLKEGCPASPVWRQTMAEHGPP